MRVAAALLTASRSLRGLADVIHAAGLAGAPVEVDASTRDALALDGMKRLELAAGLGMVRVLLAQLDIDVPLRVSLPRVSRQLSTRAPHIRWLVAAVDAAGANAGIVGWTTSDRGPRLASFLWETGRVVDSDAETLCALAACHGDDDVLLHDRAVEVLGRDALTRRFYRALEAQVEALAASSPGEKEDARGFALLYTTRLLFLSFLEAKGWLDRDRSFLASRFDDCMRTGGGFHRRVLLPLFFGTLNTPPPRRSDVARSFGRVPFLNGGLFTRTPLERRMGRWRFSDARLGELLEQVFFRFRFVAREDSATWSEASVDPEMLGLAFESLMMSSERRAGGVFYTPHLLVARVAERALDAHLKEQRGSLLSLRALRVLDPACGSGAFLVYVLERLAQLRRDAGDTADTSAIRRDVLARSIFGVDRSATAVWLCELRLWLSVVIESDEDDPHRVLPLPNLDRNIRVGDALAGGAFGQGRQALLGGARMAELRRRYVRATGMRKRALARTLDREERRRLLAQTDREIEATWHARRERLSVQRARDLFGERVPTSAATRRELKELRDVLRALRKERRRIQDGSALPFSFAAFFADAQMHGGFDIVLGNPPWVRLHRIPAALRAHLKQTYRVYRSAPWASGAAHARAASGFASQVDLAALFVERSVSLLRDGGIVSLLVPVKLWRSLAGGGVRHLLMERTDLLYLEDLSESRHAFDAAVYPSLVVGRIGPSSASRVSLAIVDRDAEREWKAPASAIVFDETPGAPWIMLPPDARAAFDRLRSAGIPMASSPLGAPRLGVKSGCNAAFIVRVTDTGRELASIVDADGEEGSVESSLLRPALRGDAVVPWSRSACGEWIVWTHDQRGAPLPRLPERARRWLRRRYGELAGRSDATHSKRWWSLFRVDAGDSSTARVVWADFGRRPKALVLPSGDPAVPLNSCYVLRCPTEPDAWAVAALLNSRLAAAWLNAIAEPARGGYRRYLGWTVGLLPLPTDWARARTILSAARRLDDESLLEAVLSAYRLVRTDVAALLEWRR
jgi:hypothetical protein